MKNKITGIAALLLVSVSVLTGCGTSLSGLGSTFNLDLQNQKLNCTLDASLFGLETNSGDSSGTGNVLFDVQLDWQNDDIRCKVDTDSSDNGDGHLDFFLNWKQKDASCVLDSKYPSTEEEKAAGSPDNNSFHFDFLLDWQKKNIDWNLNSGPEDSKKPLSNGSNKGVNEK